MTHRNIEIITPRLALRVPELEDAVEMNKALNEVWDQLQLWMSWAYDDQNALEATEFYIQNIVQEQLAIGGLPLNGYCRDTGRFVIATGITMRAGVPIIGYWVAKDFLDKGYATEASNAVLRYAFSQMGFERVQTEYYEGNDKSRNVMEKLGFIKTAVNENAHTRCSDGSPISEHVYELHKSSTLPDLEVRWRQRCR